MSQNESSRGISEALVRESAEVRAVNEELRLLYSVSTTLIRSLDLKTMLGEALTALVDLRESQLEACGTVFLIEDHRLRLIVDQRDAAPQDAFDNANDIRAHLRACDGVLVQETKLAAAAHSTEIVLVPREDIIPGAEESTGPGASLLLLPLKSAGRLVGIMCLFPKEAPDSPRISRKTLSSVGNLIAIAVDNARLYEMTRSLALHDALTGLANRRLMDIFLQRNFASARRSGTPYALVMVDIDHFKQFNDEFGHSAGDEAIQAVAASISSVIREADLAGRYGGEEFLILLPMTDVDEAAEAAERIRQAVTAQTQVKVSLGVAAYDPSLRSGRDLVKAADAAMYAAKRAGRNQVVVKRDGNL